MDTLEAGESISSVNMTDDERASITRVIEMRKQRDKIKKDKYRVTHSDKIREYKRAYDERKRQEAKIGAEVMRMMSQVKL
jgi:hypothetical protein